MDSKRKLVKIGYNKCAIDYSKHRDLFANEKYLEDLAKNLSEGASILDIGCGSGIPIDKYLLKKGFNVTGIDISDEQIKLARNNLPQGNFLVKDMTDANFSENSFDAVVSFYAIFHIPKEEHLLLFKKLNSFIKSGGFLLITMGAGEWEGTEDDFHGTKMFWSHFGREKNIELVKEAGFEIIYDMVDTSGDEKHLIVFAKKI